MQNYCKIVKKRILYITVVKIIRKQKGCLCLTFQNIKLLLKTEIMAGIITFLTMAYIIVVNPVILGDAGVPFEQAFTATIIAAVCRNIIYGDLYKLTNRNCTRYGIKCLLLLLCCKSS